MVTLNRAWLPLFLELVCAAGLLLYVEHELTSRSTAQPFSIDESRWISSSRYFWVTFVDRDVFGERWEPGYVVLTHPPVARYVLGFGLWLQGWSPDQLNARYDSSRSRQLNERAGAVPSRSLLMAARRVEWWIALAGVALVYLVSRTLGGPVAAVAGALLVASNGLLMNLWTRALAESTLATLTLLAIWLGARMVARPESRGWGVSLAAGAVLGLSAATKLSGVLTAAGFGLCALSTLVLGERRQLRSWFASWMDVGLAAVVAFVIANPLLYPDAVGRTVAMFEHRRAEMEEQRAIWPRDAVPADLVARSGLLFRRTFVDHATFRGAGSGYVEAIAVAAGLVAAAWRVFRSGREAFPALLLVCWALALYGGVTPNLGFDSTHYYAPLLLVNALLSAYALAALVAWIWPRAQMVQVPIRYRGARTSHVPITSASNTQTAGPRTAADISQSIR